MARLFFLPCPPRRLRRHERCLPNLCFNKPHPEVRMRKLFGVLVLLMSTAPLVLADTEDTAVFRVRMSPDNEVPAIPAPGVSGAARITVRPTRDLSGAVTAATVIFEVDYNLAVASTI